MRVYLGKSLTNLVGLIVLLIILLVATCIKIHSYLQERAEFNEKVDTSHRTAQQLARAFSADDKDTIVKWSRGEFKDAWGNQYEMSKTEHDYCISSSGPDNLPGTEDDIRESSPITLVEKFFGKKETPEVEKSPEEKKGWSFKWSWNRKAE